MSEKQFTSYGRDGQAEAVTSMAARLDTILAMKASPDDKLKAFDALWADARHIDRVALREICFLKLLKVMQ